MTAAVLIIEATDVTRAEWDTLLRAIHAADIPLSLSSRIRLHAAINHVAERVMDAYDGTSA